MPLDSEHGVTTHATLQLVKCVNPDCESLVRVQGEFCWWCQRVQQQMREQLQAQRRTA